MTPAELALARIEVIIEDIARLQSEIGAPMNQPSDREAFDIAARIDRKMLVKKQAAE